MSYTSDSKLARSATLENVLEVIGLLGFRKVRDGLKIKDRIAGFMWADTHEYKSYSGVELDVYRTRGGTITISTRSTVSRSHWDLAHQNRTVHLLRDFFGGSFVTDAGKNRCWRPQGNPPPLPASGCFLARWHFHNAMHIPQIFLDSRTFTGNVAREDPTGWEYVDRLNPILVSNNMVLPYLVAVWEDYCRATFIAVLKHTKDREAVLKKARLSHEHLERIAVGARSVEDSIADTMSFQRPTSIAANFRALDRRIDVQAVLSVPYKRRRRKLFESIEEMVEQRHQFVHTGHIDTTLATKRLRTFLKDLEVAADRIYVRVHTVFGWEVNRDY